MLTAETITASLLRERLPLTAYVATITRDYHLAEDIFQDVCVKAVGKSGEFESQQHLMGWARIAGRHRAIDVLRVRDGRYVGLSEEVLGALEPVWPEGDTPGGPELDALARCMERLTENNREIVRLRYFEGRSGQETAAALGRKVDTVYQALARIHRTLAECVRRRMETPEPTAAS